ncbi:Olfactory receptor 2T6 [Sciurus carolinensis]|uniref:Olfactory receptor 2T6 n=1 Tax=Sciurus carolinensis TaxID=30640 RepID=A0AA41N9S2_SCICA|nr:Olfactory receptor 2T6 [Sciurus carolinensis]
MTANGAMINLITDLHGPQLHMPMYFLLNQLCFINMLYISTTVPKMLVDYLMGKGTISFSACTAQYFLYLIFVEVKFFLGLMAYERNMVICSPLHYPALMTCCICWFILASSWSGGSLDSFLLMPTAMGSPF